MENKIIDSILQAENEAEQILSTSKNEAAKIVNDAENIAEKIKSQGVLSLKEYYKKRLSEEETEAQKNYLNLLESYQEKSNQIENSSMSNMDEALKIIIDAIV